MYGSKSKPAQNWAFSANAPVNDASSALLQELFFKSHKHQNSHVELERERIKLTEEKLLQLSAPYAALTVQLKTIEDSLDVAYEAKRKFNSTQRKRTPHQTLDAQIELLKSLRPPLWEAQSAARSLIFKTDEWKVFRAFLDGESVPTVKKDGTPSQKKKVVGGVMATKQKALYSTDTKTGLGWGTANAVKASVQAARKTGRQPRFKRYDGSGRHVIQLQKKSGKCMTFDTLLAGTSRAVQIIEKPDGVWTEGAGRPRAPELGGGVYMRKLGTAILRFKHKKKVIEVPFYLHRKPPAGTTVQSIAIRSNRTGTDHKWSVMFTLGRESWVKDDLAVNGAVAIDIGWRLQPDGALRVATWYGSDGQHGFVTLPERAQPRPEHRLLSWCDRMEATENLRSGRDTDFNVIKAKLLDHYEAHGVPDFVRELVNWKGDQPTDGQIRSVIANWHAQLRLVRLALAWREHRYDGDEEIFTEVENWRAHDKHLFNYEALLRAKLQNNRRDIYRNVAADLSRRYATVVLEGESSAKDKKESKRRPKKDQPSTPMDLRVFHENPGPEASADTIGQPGSRAKENVRNAAISVLRDCLKRARHLVTEPAAGTSKRCSDCRAWNNLGAEQVYTCNACGLVIDRDVNAAKNLLTAYNERLAAAALSSVKTSNPEFEQSIASLSA